MESSHSQHVNELLTGKGYIILTQIFSRQQIEEARNLIMKYSSAEVPKVTHFQTGNENKQHLQRRVWNLLNKGQVFVDMIQYPTIMDIVGRFLGDEFCLGSIAANRILPGGPGQQPHVDYPYWDMYKRSSFPVNINPSFPLNCQVTVLLDTFTEETGATAVLPGSQKWCRYPSVEDEKMFYERSERMLGKPGDVAIFYGLTWHCAMPNRSEHDRSAILIQYLPKFVKPMEDQQRGVRKDIIEKGTPVFKQLLGYEYPYPQVLDDAKAENAEGRDD